MTSEEILDLLATCADRPVPPRPPHLRWSAEQLRAVLAATTPQERERLGEIAERAHQTWAAATEADERDQQNPAPAPP